ncbi:hypothetical protein ACNI3Q_00540 [Sphingomonas sp. FW199]|uniref:PAS domain-containing protein n=1 Tax=Sphingomonas sp. FW199 TaxID=3400217 RepID=UPI003CEFF187
MDTVRGTEDRIEEHDGVEDAAHAANAQIGTDERRMHVRAYNYWVSLLNGRAYPSIEDLDPQSLADFGPHSVLLDFSSGIDDPSIRFLGDRLSAECGVSRDIASIAEVPGRSLLSRLTDHYLQIIANRAPIGFEAEFVSHRGLNTLYRGILMPFSSGSDSIDYIYGVINWKEMVDSDTQARLNAEIEAARRAAPPPPPTEPVWADGPSGDVASPSIAVEAADVDEAAPPPPALPGTLSERLMLARESAAAVRAADTRSRAALYRALGRAYDVALAAGADQERYARLLAESGIKEQARAPMTPVVKLVFGSDYDKARVTEFAAVLSQARRMDVAAGGLADLLERTEGGIKALVKAERSARAPAPRPDRYSSALKSLRSAPALGSLNIDPAGEEFVLLVARATGKDQVEVVGQVGNAPALVRQAVVRAIM